MLWDCVKNKDTSGNNCASFNDVATVIRIMSMIQGTAFLEQSSLYFHCLIHAVLFRVQKLSVLVIQL